MAARQSAALSVNPRYTTLVTLPRVPVFSLLVFNVIDLPLPRNRPRRIYPLSLPLPSQLCTPLVRDGARNRAAN